MSAAEVIAEIKKLPRQEREEVVSFVSTNQSKLIEDPQKAKMAVSFDEAAEAVFAKHDELLRRLAQ